MRKVVGVVISKLIVLLELIELQPDLGVVNRRPDTPRTQKPILHHLTSPMIIPSNVCFIFLLLLKEVLPS